MYQILKAQELTTNIFEMVVKAPRVSNAAFYCYVIADITDSLEEDAANAGLNRTPDGEGFFGFNAPRGAYIEVISYTKLLKDAKQRNEVLFDKLFRPKSNQITDLVEE